MFYLYHLAVRKSRNTGCSKHTDTKNGKQATNPEHVVRVACIPSSTKAVGSPKFTFLQGPRSPKLKHTPHILGTEHLVKPSRAQMTESKLPIPAAGSNSLQRLRNSVPGPVLALSGSSNTAETVAKALAVRWTGNEKSKGMFAKELGLLKAKIKRLATIAAAQQQLLNNSTLTSGHLQ